MPLPWPNLTDAQWKVVLQKAAAARAAGEPVPSVSEVFPEVAETIMVEDDADADAEDEA